jgi:large subunit ribosomal protein L35e
LTVLQKELAALRVQKVSSQAQVNLQKIRVLRKGVAKILTILTEKRRDSARTAFKKARHTPKDLR